MAKNSSNSNANIKILATVLLLVAAIGLGIAYGANEAAAGMFRALNSAQSAAAGSTVFGEQRSPGTSASEIENTCQDPDADLWWTGIFYGTDVDAVIEGNLQTFSNGPALLEKPGVSDYGCIGDAPTVTKVVCPDNLADGGTSCEKPNPSGGPWVGDPIVTPLFDESAGTIYWMSDEPYTESLDPTIVEITAQAAAMTAVSSLDLAGLSLQPAPQCNDAEGVFEIDPKSFDHAVPTTITWTFKSLDLSTVGYVSGPVDVQIWGLGQPTKLATTGATFDGINTVTFTTPQVPMSHWGPMALQLSQTGAPTFTFGSTDWFVTQPSVTVTPYDTVTGALISVPVGDHFIPFPINSDYKFRGYGSINDAAFHPHFGPLNPSIGPLDLPGPDYTGGDLGLDPASAPTWSMFGALSSPGIVQPSQFGCHNFEIVGNIPNDPTLLGGKMAFQAATTVTAPQLAYSGGEGPTWPSTAVWALSYYFDSVICQIGVSPC